LKKVMENYNMRLWGKGRVMERGEGRDKVENKTEKLRPRLRGKRWL